MEGSVLEQRMFEEDRVAERGYYGLTVTPIPLSCLGGEESERVKPSLGRRGWAEVLF